jgi:nucleotide-binding universal stress UspA family protein
MFKTIVWATDGSENADRALPYAKELASRDGAELVAMHVVETFVGQRAVGQPLYADEPDRRARIERQVAGLASDGIDARALMLPTLRAAPAHQIADAARDVHADLIVVGTRGESQLAGLLLGSVTQRLLHIAPCPVVAVPNVRSRHALSTST